MKVSLPLAVMVGLGLAVGLLKPLGLRFNLTASLPLGLYRVTSDPAVRGSIVHVCLDSATAEFARGRGYLGPGSCPSGVRPLGKVVLAVEGDVVTLKREEISVNGEAVSNSGTVSVDSHGRSLPHHPWGAYRLAYGELWLFSPYQRNAYDSRYFGPVRRSQVVSVLVPMWTRQGDGVAEAEARGSASDGSWRIAATAWTRPIVRAKLEGR